MGLPGGQGEPELVEEGAAPDRRSCCALAAVVPPLPDLLNANSRFRPLHLVVREKEFCRLRLAEAFSRSARGKAAAIRFADRAVALPLTNHLELRWLLLPGNRAGLSGLYGGRCRDRTCDPSRVKGVLYR